MLVFATLVTLSLAAFFAVQTLTSESRQRRRSLARVAEYDTRPKPAVGRTRRATPSSTRPGIGLPARIALKLTPRRNLETIALRLARAGLAPRISPNAFLVGKLVLGVVGAFLGVLLGLGSIGRIFVFALALSYGAFFLPEFLVSRRLTQRLETIEADLPSALDVLAVSVEAGLGLDAALATLVEHSDGPLVDELGFALAEMRMGESRANVMKRLADRVEVPEVATFANAVVQGDRLGIPLTRILHTLAADMRVRRQTIAEERANKMPVKMVFPLAFFILPALLIVTIGPAVIAIAQSFK